MRNVCSCRINSRIAPTVAASVIWCAIATSPAMAQHDEKDVQWGGAIIHLNDRSTMHTPYGTVQLPTAAQLSGVSIEPALRELVQQFEDPSFAVREHANRQLMEMAPDKMQIYALLVNEGGALTAEQRYRLLAVLRETLLRSPRGAIGISMQPIQVNGGAFGGGLGIEIRVTDLLPGLPAEKVLKIGDRIAKVDHKPLMTQNDLLMRVQSKKPGDSVAITVKRPKLDEEGRVVNGPDNEPVADVLEIDLVLGSADLLRRFDDAGMHQFNVSQSPVETMRQAEADAAVRRLAPSSRPIALDADSKVALTDLSAAPQEATFIAEANVDEDPVVQHLLVQRNMLAKGEVTPQQLQMMRHQWDLTLVDLYRRSQSRSLTHDQHDYLQELIERATELMEWPADAQLTPR